MNAEPHPSESPSARILRLRGLGAPLRWTLIGVYAGLFVLALTVLLREHLGPDRLPTSISSPMNPVLVTVCAVLGLAALSLFLAGTVRAPSWTRLVGTGLLALAIEIVMQVFLPLIGAGSRVFLWSIFGVVTVLVPVYGFIRSTRMRATALTAFLALAVLLLGALAWLSRMPEAGGYLILESFVVIIIFSIPAITIVGADFAETLESLASPLVARTSRELWAWILCVVTGAAALVTPLMSRESTLSLDRAESCGLVVAIGAVAIAAVRTTARRAPAARHVSYWAMAALAAILYGYMVETSKYLMQLAGPPVINVQGVLMPGLNPIDPRAEFSITVPKTWKIDVGRSDIQPRAEDESASSLIRLDRPKPLPAIDVVAHTHSRERHTSLSRLNDIIFRGADFEDIPFDFHPGGPTRLQMDVEGSLKSNGRKFHLTSFRGQSGVSDHVTDWFITCVATAETAGKFASTCQTIAGSFVPRVQKESSRLGRLVGIWGWLIVAAIAWFSMWAVRARPHGMAGFGILLLVAALFIAVRVWTIGTLDPGSLFEDEVQAGHFIRIAVLAAGASSIVIALLSGIRPLRTFFSPWLRPLVRLNLGLLIVWALFALYAEVAHWGAETAAAKAAILIGALTVDVFFSGAFTNLDTPEYPRSSRILLFLGYSLMAAVLVVFFEPLALGGRKVNELNAEHYAATGLAAIGVPLMISMFALHVGGARKDEATGR